MKKSNMNSITSQILKIGLFCMIGLFTFSSAKAQNGQVPELVSIEMAVKLLVVEVDLINDQIKNIESSGNPVPQEMYFKSQLFSLVLEELQKNNSGMTTFLAIAANSNYKGVKMDDAAYNDLITGAWDENMADLIRILTK